MFVSIGIPIYNAENFLKDCINSILAQTYPYWELILIDDGSTDNSLGVAYSFAQQDSRIRVISDGYNKKLSNRLNQIIDEAKYDYIARMDADDIVDPTRIEKQLKILMEKKNIDFVSTGICSISDKNQVKGIRIYNNYVLNAYDILSGNSGIVHASILARKSWYMRNRYRENIVAEDYELWNRAFFNNDLNFFKIEEPLYYYREEGNVTYIKLRRAYKSQIEVIKLYRGNLDIKRYNILKYKMYFKIFVIFVLNSFGLLGLLLKRRVAQQPTHAETHTIQENINRIAQMDFH